MDTPGTEERNKVNATMSWGYHSFLNNNLNGEEAESRPKKLNIIHFICIGMFLALAFLTIAATIYSFVS